MAALVLLLALAAGGPQPSLTLELRLFDGPADVTAESRVVIYRAGERTDPLLTVSQRPGAVTLPVAPGFYDVQAIHLKDDRVANIRWVERLIVMPYPDERGRHLEVVNFKDGYGALQVRGKDGGAVPDVALYPAGRREKEAATPVKGDGYVLFVVAAGPYDLLLRGGTPAWHADIEVPADGTRLWIPQ